MAYTCGVWNETTDEDIEEIQKICDQVKSEVENMTNKTYVEYRAVKYRTQILSGVNLVVKVFCGVAEGVSCGVERYIHLNLFQDEEKVVVLCVEQQKTKEDPLVPF